MSPQQEQLRAARGCDANYSELIDGRFARSVRELTGYDCPVYAVQPLSIFERLMRKVCAQ